MLNDTTQARRNCFDDQTQNSERKLTAHSRQLTVSVQFALSPVANSELRTAGLLREKSQRVRTMCRRFAACANPEENYGEILRSLLAWPRAASQAFPQKDMNWQSTLRMSTGDPKFRVLRSEFCVPFRRALRARRRAVFVCNHAADRAAPARPRRFPPACLRTSRRRAWPVVPPPVASAKSASR